MDEWVSGWIMEERTLLGIRRGMARDEQNLGSG